MSGSSGLIFPVELIVITTQGFLFFEDNIIAVKTPETPTKDDLIKVWVPSSEKKKKIPTLSNDCYKPNDCTDHSLT